MALKRHLLSGLGLEAIRQLEKLGLKMVDGKALVVQWAMQSLRIGRIVKAGAEPPGNVETARRPDHSDGIQPVGVLQDFCFQRFRCKIGRKTMSEDCVGDRLDAARWPLSVVSQDCFSFLCGKAGRIRSVGRVLFHGNAIMEQYGRGENLTVAAFDGMNAHGVFEHPQNMGGVMRTVIALSGMRQEPFGKIVMRGEGCGDHRGIFSEGITRFCCIIAQIH